MPSSPYPYLTTISAFIQTYIHLNTNAVIENINSADYVFLNGKELISNFINECKSGDLSYPEKAATLIIKVEQLSVTPIDDFDCKLILSGPGIQSENILFVYGLLIQNIQSIQSLNTEFPLGVDIILTDASENICSIPRSISFQINQNN
jgi:alpha-D-ribose 1-methylphosphonate 5-triphosphate synthase subunit PhnH